ncbi:hypothetical protein NQ176_g8853 [Zarea fungicola]|uniref:Uncharacterized protein n=1 Tax=Zarea fungicola TaxID=93591 RepID=A0ACC1MPY8_9HYPO|nr:hypothetical protein NQ176_g8853 [Lecanicillium fungicola]
MPEENPKRYFPPIQPPSVTTPVQHIPAGARTIGGLQQIPTYPPASLQGISQSSLFGNGQHHLQENSSLPEYSNEGPIFTPRVKDTKDGPVTGFHAKEKLTAAVGPGTAPPGVYTGPVVFVDASRVYSMLLRGIYDIGAASQHRSVCQFFEVLGGITYVTGCLEHRPSSSSNNGDGINTGTKCQRLLDNLKTAFLNGCLQRCLAKIPSSSGGINIGSSCQQLLNNL